MTEAILLSAAAQAKHIISMDEKIELAVAKANKAQCGGCKAMKHAEAEEEKARHEKIIEQWKRSNGYSEGERGPGSWMDALKTALVKPYLYIVIALALVSPYGVQMFEKLLQFYAAK